MLFLQGVIPTVTRLASKALSSCNSLLPRETTFCHKNSIPTEQKISLKKVRDLFLLQHKLNFKD